MPTLCRGEFSEETKQQLRDEYMKDPGGLLIKRCARCGTSVVAENKSGEWVPETHGPPTQRVYKGAGGKRTVGKSLIVTGKASADTFQVEEETPGDQAK
jgi:hypothetical protein